MIKLLFMLIWIKINSFSKVIFITNSRLACSLDQSDCDGSKSKPFSNPIIAIRKSVKENLNDSELEFFFEAGGAHLILESDFLIEISSDSRKPLFEKFEGKSRPFSFIKKNNFFFHKTRFHLVVIIRRRRRREPTRRAYRGTGFNFNKNRVIPPHR